MGRSVPILAVVVALVAGSAAAGAAVPEERRAGGVKPRSGPARVQVVACQQGRVAADRLAVFRGVMRQVPEGETMQMRFALERRAGRRFEPVAAPGLGVWHESRPGVERFAYRQRVVGLARATVYRAVVRFRWHDADGERVAIAHRRSRPCRERGRLPNLVVGRLAEPLPGPAAGPARYRVRVGNTGRAPARAVEVVLSVDGVASDSRTLRVLRRGERRVLRLLGPVCVERATVAIDPGNEIAELSERDNERTLACADGGSAATGGR